MGFGIATLKGRRDALGAILLIVFASAGCSGVPSPSKAPAIASTSASSPGAVSTQSANPTPPPSPLPTPPLMGKWTGIRWTKVTSNDPHWLSPDRFNGPNVNGWTTFGWSRGFISFGTALATHQDNSWTAVTSVAQSVDGVSWASSGSFTISGPNDKDPFASNGVVGIVEAAGGLLAYTGVSFDCSWKSHDYTPVAASSDGATWTNVTQSLGSIQGIDGAGAGYIATGEAGVYTSVDGLHWTKAALAGNAFARLDLVRGGGAADGGFVILGVALGSKGGGYCDIGPVLLSPTLWFSGDGTAWSKLALPGALAGSDVALDFCRAGRLLVTNERAGGKTATWSSANGTTWNVSHEAFSCAAARDAADREDLITGGGREIFILPAEKQGPPSLMLVNDALTETTLAQSGDLPDWNHVGPVAGGPAGIIASSGDGTLWLGVPVTQ